MSKDQLRNQTSPGTHNNSGARLDSNDLMNSSASGFSANIRMVNDVSARPSVGRLMHQLGMALVLAAAEREVLPPGWMID